MSVVVNARVRLRASFEGRDAGESSIWPFYPFSERAVPRVRCINAAHRACRNELDSDRSCLGATLVADDVHVASPRIDKPDAHPRRGSVNVGRAIGIVAVVLGHGSCCDDDQAMTGM